MISTRELCAWHPFAGQNTQHLTLKGETNFKSYLIKFTFGKSCMEINNFSLTQLLEIPSFAPLNCSAWGKCPRCPALGTALQMPTVFKS